MFHLLVQGGGWAQAKDSIGRDRVFEYTDDALIKQFKSSDRLNTDRIMSLPALFMSETDGKGDQKARVGSIIRVEMSGTQVNLDYTFDDGIPPISNSTLEKLSLELQINRYEFHRTHWAIKNVDLFKILLRNQAATPPSPKVFSVDKLEEVDNTLVSVMMPFNSGFNDVYAKIKTTAEELQMQCLRADDIWQNYAVIQDIVSLINRSRLIVCDCSGRNANVFYEVGIAHTLGRDFILITQSEEDIPFDLRHLRYLQYLDNNEGREQLAKRLRDRMITLLKR